MVYITAPFNLLNIILKLGKSLAFLMVTLLNLIVLLYSLIFYLLSDLKFFIMMMGDI